MKSSRSKALVDEWPPAELGYRREGELKAHVVILGRGEAL
jgi:hypothetical protein